MKTPILIAACLASTLSATFAIAGACTTEVDDLAKTMPTKDAGSGPTSGATPQPRKHSLVRASIRRLRL